MEALLVLNPSPCCCQFGDFASKSSFGLKSQISTTWSKGCGLVSVDQKLRRNPVLVNSRRILRVRASSSSSPIAPLQLESPIGQFLSQILLSHPHLLSAAVDQQLEQLRTAREAEKNRDESSSSGTDLVLYRRIAEVKAKERRRALEEILYALVVQKFVEANVFLIPPLVQSADSSGRVDPSEEKKFECLHSFEVSEMIKNYMTQILGPGLDDANMVVAINKLQIGRVYAASIMFGYFLKRVDQRFQLEKSMKALPWGSNEESAVKLSMPNESSPSSQAGNSHRELSSWSSTSFSPNGPNGHSFGSKPSRLWTYVMTFDMETTRRYVTIRSKEAFNIIEKQTEALFGKSDILTTPPGSVNSSQDELIKMSFGGLKRLILEAITFGSFLWDVESYVDSRYHFVNK